MNVLLRCYLLYLLLVVISGCRSLTYARRNDLPPSFVLVQLRTGYNRVQHLQKFPGKQAEIATLLGNIQEVNDRMILDFREHFSYCPVYFFYDTTWNRVVGRDFKGSIYNKDLEVVADVKLLESDTTHFILSYGYEEEAEEWQKQTILASNWRGKQLSSRLPYKRRGPATTAYKYNYYSTSHGIEYRAYARAYSRTLDEFYRRFKKRG